VFLDDLIKVLFCKHYMDIHSSAPPVASSDEVVAYAYRSALDAVSARLPHVFSGESFLLGDSTLAFIHGSIAGLDMENRKADLVGDAFEHFTGNDARGQEGQFFTPHNAIQATPVSGTSDANSPNSKSRNSGMILIFHGSFGAYWKDGTGLGMESEASLGLRRKLRFIVRSVVRAECPSDVGVGFENCSYQIGDWGIVTGVVLAAVARLDHGRRQVRRLGV
jgi:hypothetical protein